MAKKQATKTTVAKKTTKKSAAAKTETTASPTVETPPVETPTEETTTVDAQPPEDTTSGQPPETDKPTETADPVVAETPSADLGAPVVEVPAPVEKKKISLDARACKYLSRHLPTVGCPAAEDVKKVVAAVESGKVIGAVRGVGLVESTSASKLLSKHGKLVICTYPEQLYVDRVISRR